MTSDTAGKASTVPDPSSGTRSRARKGQVLGASEILARLVSGEIFRPGTWIKECIRGAAYDLTIARDYMVIPDDRSKDGRRHFPRGTYCGDNVVVLKPGDVALFSSNEKFKMPWDLTANIGGKFSLARQGLLILTGQFVDPGYGYENCPPDSAPQSEGERLHFLVSNIGNNNIALIPGVSRIATLQFLIVSGQTHREQTFQSSDMDAEFFGNDPAVVAMGLVGQMVSVQEGLADIRREEDRLRREFERLEKGTTPLILFGVLVVASAFLGVVLTTLLVMAGSNELVNHVTRLREAMGGGWQLMMLIILLIMAIVSLGVLARAWTSTILRRIFKISNNRLT